MENTRNRNGKSKKIAIGVATIVAAAAIAVPTALVLTGGNDDAGANQGNKYNIVVSCEIDGVADYSLSISEGTKISELKSILKGVDGYKIEGIYKDDAMIHPYLDNETISASTKIYIKFVAVIYTVNIYAEDCTTLLESQEVSHKDSITLTAPTKAEDNFATYEFKGWYNERNELVNLNEITSDLNIHPEYRTIMKEYKMGYIGGEFKDSISVTVGGKPVTLNDTYHYGSKIVIRATQKAGRDITEFKVKVGNGETQNILTETYRHEENGVVYYEYELIGNGDLIISYNESEGEYSIGTIPSQVTVTRNGHTLSSNEAIYYGDQLSISYRETEGYHKDTFSVDGAELVGNVYVVKGNINITYIENKIEYTLGTIPNGVTVMRGEESLSSNSTIYWGDTLSFNYEESITRNTGATKQEEGYHYYQKEIVSYVLQVNGTDARNGSQIVVDKNLILNLNSSSVYEWIKGERIEYSLGTIPVGVTVMRGAETLSDNAVLYWGDYVVFTYTNSSSRYTGVTKQEEGYNYKEKELTVFTLYVNSNVQNSGTGIEVSKSLVLELTSAIETEWEQGEKIVYSLGTIPSGVTVKKENVTLNSNSDIYWGDQLVFTYTESSSMYTGNKKTENGYEYNEKKITTNTLRVNETTIVRTGGKFSVKGDVTLKLTTTTKTEWERGEAVLFADFEVDGNYVYGYNGSERDINIPVIVDETIIDGVDLSRFEPNNLDSITFPSNIKYIEGQINISDLKIRVNNLSALEALSNCIAGYNTEIRIPLNYVVNYGSGRDSLELPTFVGDSSWAGYVDGTDFVIVSYERFQYFETDGAEAIVNFDYELYEDFIHTHFLDSNPEIKRLYIPTFMNGHTITTIFATVEDSSYEWNGESAGSEAGYRPLFANRDFNHVSLPLLLESIVNLNGLNSLFENCNELNSIYIPENITEDISQIIYGCTALQTIYLDNQFCLENFYDSYNYNIPETVEIAVSPRLIYSGNLSLSSYFSDRIGFEMYGWIWFKSGTDSNIYDNGNLSLYLADYFWYNGKVLEGTTAILPSVVNGGLVTSIDPQNFEGSYFNNLYIPSSVTTIENYFTQSYDNIIINVSKEFDFSGSIRLGEGVNYGGFSCNNIILNCDDPQFFIDNWNIAADFFTYEVVDKFQITSTTLGNIAKYDSSYDFSYFPVIFEPTDGTNSIKEKDLYFSY